MKPGKTNQRALFQYLLKFWRTFVVVLVPLICLPLLFVDKHDEKVRNGKREIPPYYVRPGTERFGAPGLTRILTFFQIFKCAWVLLIVASYWVTEALPLAITSLIPVALLPILGIIYKLD